MAKRETGLCRLGRYIVFISCYIHDPIPKMIRVFPGDTLKQLSRDLLQNPKIVRFVCTNMKQRDEQPHINIIDKRYGCYFGMEWDVVTFVEPPVNERAVKYLSWIHMKLPKGCRGNVMILSWNGKAMTWLEANALIWEMTSQTENAFIGDA